ncbi:MAG: hypothetical protein ACR2HX_06140 [Pyrinomonadaceae bacterium]
MKNRLTAFLITTLFAVFFSATVPALAQQGPGVQGGPRERTQEKQVLYREVTISSANITGTAVGQLGHTNGVVLVAAPGARKALEFISAVVILDYATAAYGGAGTVQVNYAAGGNQTSLSASAANSIGGAADKMALLLVSTPGGGGQLTANAGLNLTSSIAFTQPGTAAGVVRVKIAYRVHTHGL